MDKDPVQVLYTLLGRTSLFFTLFLSSLLMFYIMGNYQEFLDSSQSLILKSATASSIFLVFFSVCELAVSIIQFVRRRGRHHRGRYVASIVCTSLAIVYGILFMTATRVIEYLSSGI